MFGPAMIATPRGRKGVRNYAAGSAYARARTSLSGWDEGTEQTRACEMSRQAGSELDD